MELLPRVYVRAGTVGEMTEFLLQEYTYLPTDVAVAVAPRIVGEHISRDEVAARCTATLFYLLRTEREGSKVREKMGAYLDLTRRLLFAGGRRVPDEVVSPTVDVV